MYLNRINEEEKEGKCKKMIGYRLMGKTQKEERPMCVSTHLCSPYNKSRVLLISATLSAVHSGCVEVADAAGTKRSTAREVVRRG